MPSINDDFANAILISGASGTESGDLTANTNEAGEPVPYYWYFGPGASVWYEWTCPATGTYRFYLENGVFDDVGVLSIYTGTSVESLTRVASNDGFENEAIGIDATSGVTYRIQVSTYDFFTTPQTFDLGWETWPRATNDSFATATLIDTLTGSIDTDNHAFPGEREDGAPLTEELMGLDAEASGRYAWFKVEPPASGRYEFTFTADKIDYHVALFEGETLEALSLIFTDGDEQILSGGYGAEILTADLVSGGNYYALFAGNSFPDPTGGFDTTVTWSVEQIEQGEFTLDWIKLAPQNDDRLDADDSGNIPGQLNYWPSYVYGGVENGPVNFSNQSAGRGALIANTIGATSEVGEPSHAAGFGPTRSVWFFLGNGPAGNYRFWLEPTGSTPVVDALMAIYDYTTGALGAALASDDDSGAGLMPEFTVALAEDDAYWVVVDSRDEGEFTINYARVPAEAAPANDDFANATIITPGTPVSGTTEGATIEPEETPSAGFWGGPWGSVWYAFMPLDDGVLGINFTAGTTTPGGYNGIVDVFEGSTLGDLVNITPADDFNNAAYDQTIFFPFEVHAGVPIYIRVTTYFDQGQAFDIELAEQSSTPPTNDDFDDADGANGGSNPGTTDGSTVEDGEANPIGGGPLDPGSGSTWHTYTAPASGFVDIWAERTGLPVNDWYRVGVWVGGPVRANLLYVLSYNTESAFPVIRRRFEVREGETYWIQVIREPDQSWGAYDLVINEYLGTTDWSLDTDGFDSTSGSTSVTGGELTCEGGAGYGRVDLNPNTWNKIVRVYMEVKHEQGRYLINHGTTSGDIRTPGSNRRELGLLRFLDKDGENMVCLFMDDLGNGENLLTVMRGDTAATIGVNVPLSFGERSADEQGWVTIEVEIVSRLRHSAVGTSQEWYLRTIWVDGRAYHLNFGNGTFNDASMDPGALNGARYVDFGYWRYTSFTDPHGHVENPDTWRTKFRNLRVTDISSREEFDLSGDPNQILMFDGLTYEAIPSGSTNFLTNSGTKVIESWPGKTWNGMRSTDETPQSVIYSAQWGQRRWYGFHFHALEWPSFETAIAGYTNQNYASSNELSATGRALATLSLTENGTLWITPWFTPAWCVAQLTLGETYWIEVHVDAEVMWDIQVEIFINGSSFGVFSNLNHFTWSRVLSGSQPFAGSAGGDYAEYNNGFFFTGNDSPTHDWYGGNFVVGRGEPEDSVGPVAAVGQGVLTDVGTHWLPDDDGHEIIDLYGTRFSLWEPAAWKIWGWDVVGHPEWVGPCVEETNDPEWVGGATGVFDWHGPSLNDEGISVITEGADNVLKIEIPSGTSPGSGRADFWLFKDDTRWHDTTPDGGLLGDNTLIVMEAKSPDGVDIQAESWGDPARAQSEPSYSPTVALSTNYFQYWGFNMVLWSAFAISTGVSPIMRLTDFAVGDEVYIKHFRMFSDPHVFPRYAKVADDTVQSESGGVLTGPAYDLITLDDTDSHTFVGDDVSEASDGAALFTDTTGALKRLDVNDGEIIWPASSPRATAHAAYNMPWWYLEYQSSDSPADVIAANMWVRFRGNHGPPHAAEDDYVADAGRLRVHVADASDNVRRVETFSGSSSASSTEDDKAILRRAPFMRLPDGSSWPQAQLEDALVRLGFHNYLAQGLTYTHNTGSYGIHSDQRFGACVYAMSWEFLVPVEADPPPPPCGGAIDLTRITMRAWYADGDGGT